ncbi:hypothetical protein [Limnobacter sp.]|uniref:hypothetical protein n=1 Tax=Limnobacter sp. TaxID=2003368 RepID=UPI00311F1095
MRHIIKKYWGKHRSKALLKQEAMLKIALLEIGVSPEWVKIEVDHLNGMCLINKIPMNVIFPRVYFDIIEPKDIDKRKNDFYFNGYKGGDGGRERLMKPFEKKGGLVIYSENGRRKENKGQFNKDYMVEMSDSKYSLCPHQLDWPHKSSTIWTYRFIEACIAFSIPVVFEQTPLSKEFIGGFRYVTDRMVLSEKLNFDNEDVKHNWKLARERHTISEKIEEDIWRSI